MKQWNDDYDFVPLSVVKGLPATCRCAKESSEKQGQGHGTEASSWAWIWMGGMHPTICDLDLIERLSKSCEGFNRRHLSWSTLAKGFSLHSGVFDIVIFKTDNPCGIEFRTNNAFCPSPVPGFRWWATQISWMFSAWSFPNRLPLWRVMSLIDSPKFFQWLSFPMSVWDLTWLSKFYVCHCCPLRISCWAGWHQTGTMAALLWAILFATRVGIRKSHHDLLFGWIGEVLWTCASKPSFSIWQNCGISNTRPIPGSIIQFFSFDRLCSGSRCWCGRHHGNDQLGLRVWLLASARILVAEQGLEICWKIQRKADSRHTVNDCQRQVD